MKYTLPKSYSNAGIQVEIPETELRALRNALGNTKAAIDNWLFTNGYMTETEYTEQKAKAAEKAPARKREFKVDIEKSQIVTMLAAALNETDKIDNINIVNPNRLISFSLGNDKYELTLTRKKK